MTSPARILQDAYDPTNRALRFSSTGQPHRRVAATYTVPGFGGNGVGVTAATNNLLLYEPFLVQRSVSVAGLACEVTTLGAGNVRMAVYGSDGFQATGAPLIESGNISTASTGIKPYTLATAMTLAPGYYCTAYAVDNATVRLRTLSGSMRDSLIAFGASPYYTGTFVSPFVFGAFPNPATAATGTSTGTVGQVRSVVLDLASATP